jgi:hypothetical protein
MRLASFNVENLFARAKALNATAMGAVESPARNLITPPTSKRSSSLVTRYDISVARSLP